jgi:hypothetical protein
MAKERLFMQMEVTIKECGKIIKKTDLVYKKIYSKELCIKVIGKII